LYKAGTRKEWIRALVAALITGVAVYYMGSVLMSGLQEPAGRIAFIDAIYIHLLLAL